MKNFRIISRKKDGPIKVDKTTLPKRLPPEEKKEKSSLLKVIDRGPTSIEYGQVGSSLLEGLSKNHTVFAQRIHFSDRFLFKHCLDLLIGKQDFIVIVVSQGPLPSDFLNNSQVELMSDYLGWPKKLVNGTVYALESDLDKSLSRINNFLEELYKGITFENITNNCKIILICDVNSKITEPLSNNLRNWMRARFKDIHFTLWLHCPLVELEISLLSHFGNVISHLPTISDLKKMELALPIEFDDNELNNFRNGMIAFGPCLGANTKIKGLINNLSVPNL